jgi:hypothetical protein
MGLFHEKAVWKGPVYFRMTDQDRTSGKRRKIFAKFDNQGQSDSPSFGKNLPATTVS